MLKRVDFLQALPCNFQFLFGISMSLYDVPAIEVTFSGQALSLVLFFGGIVLCLDSIKSFSRIFAFSKTDLIGPWVFLSVDFAVA